MFAAGSCGAITENGKSLDHSLKQTPKETDAFFFFF